MGEEERYRNKIELLQGTLDMLILQTLRWGAQHGYGIAQAIRSGSSGVLQVETGSMYPALHRLEKQGWIKSEWKTSGHNQRAKYYQLTAAGKKQLGKEHSRWERMAAAIGGLMNPGESEGEA
jgi:PadR family transcriptional regulator, regulatory protein PadR